MTYTQAMTQIIFPQAFKIVIPPLGNQFINLVKIVPFWPSLPDLI